MSKFCTETQGESGQVIDNEDKSEDYILKSVEEDVIETIPLHLIKQGIRCGTEDRGYKTPHGRSPAELVVNASEGFIPLWAKDTVLRWKFRDSSFDIFQSSTSLKVRIEEIFSEALVAWGDAAPIKFSKNDDAWDFEIVMMPSDNCGGGCVLASAFFPDSGRHQLLVYPKIFEQEQKEQVETFVHEIGHIFGLRHFFAQVSETAWPSAIFGEHNKFSIMNYAEYSELTLNDKSDLKRLYQMAWSGELADINKTPIRFFTPFHSSGSQLTS